MENKVRANPAVDTLRDIWATTPGKVVIVASASLVALGFAGIAFKVFAYTMNNYKDFRDAWRR